MSSFTVTNSNCSLRYVSGGTANVARLRCSGVFTAWEINAEESHARQHRAYYPHWRTQGEFALRIDCKHWPEYDRLMSWLRGYAAAALAAGTSTKRIVPPPMMVDVPSRNLSRYGYPTTGIGFGDHIGSNVFSPVVRFISVYNPGDPLSGVIGRGSASGQDLSKVQPDVKEWFYPGSTEYSSASVQSALLGAVWEQEAADAPVTGRGVTNPQNPRQSTG